MEHCQQLQYKNKKYNNMNVMSKFNLPKYVKGKSFSEASALIAKRFEDRSDPESVATLNDLQGRLQQAQEHVKKQAEAEQQSNQAALMQELGGGESQGQPQHQMPGGEMMPGASHEQPQGQEQMSMGGSMGGESNDYFLGGVLEGLKPAGIQNVGSIESLAPKPSDLMQSPGVSDVAGKAGGALDKLGGAAGIMGAASGAMELGKMAFGKPNVDTSGATTPMETESGFAAGAKGAMTGAQAGGAIVPGIGHLVGGVLGVGAGLLGNGKAKRAEQEARVQNTGKQAKEFNNSYAGGGFMNSTDPNELMNMLNDSSGNGIDFMAENDKAMASQQEGSPYANQQRPRAYASDIEGSGIQDTLRPKVSGLELPEQAGAQQVGYGKDLRPRTESFDIDQVGLQGFGSFEDWAPKESDLMQPSSAKEFNAGDYLKAYGDIAGNYVKENGSEALRYAPAITDAYQLANLKKPEDTSRGRLGNKYKEQPVDERELVQQVQEGVSSQRDAILGASGGSQSAARANLLGLNLQGTKALSNAMQQAGEANRNDRRAGQQFNAGIDKVNLQQSNAEQLANEQNQGAYDSQKSQLISQLGANLGEVGKEQLFKKYPELMGMDFDAMGKYLKSKKTKKK